MISFRGPATVIAFTFASAAGATAQGRGLPASGRGDTLAIAVSGSGLDHLTASVVHSVRGKPHGTIQQSTEIVDLAGDLVGRVLYHVTTAVDSLSGTLVNTGDQVFSGTIAGSAPVLIHDNRFRFDVNLKTGRETGRVYLSNHIAGPRVRCTLDVVGTGLNEGNPTFTYTGWCTFLDADAHPLPLKTSTKTQGRS
jgi:hypothetical protein